MARFELYTNYLSDKDKASLIDQLNAGNSVCVSSNCIGHTLAQMVKNQGEQFLESLGCIIEGYDVVGNKYYWLPDKASDCESTHVYPCDRTLDGLCPYGYMDCSLCVGVQVD